jgi:hypothetical protein
MSGKNQNYGSHGMDQKRTAKKKERFNDATFINIELDKAQSAECKSWEVAAVDLFEFLLGVADAGYSTTIKWDDFSEAYSAFMRPLDTTSANDGLILTSRGSSVFKAVKQLAYLHNVVTEGNWGPFKPQQLRLPLDD